MASEEASSLERQEEDLESRIDELRQKLSNDYDQDPSLVNTYISDVFGGELPEGNESIVSLCSLGQQYSEEFAGMSDDVQNRLIEKIVNNVDPNSFDANTSTYIRDLVALQAVEYNHPISTEYDKENRRVKLDELQQEHGMNLAGYKAHIVEQIKANPEVIGRYLEDSDNGVALLSDAQVLSDNETYMAMLKSDYQETKIAFAEFGENPTFETKQIAQQHLDNLQETFDAAPDDIHWSRDTFSYVELNSDTGERERIDVYMSDIRDQISEGKEALQRQGGVDVLAQFNAASDPQASLDQDLQAQISEIKELYKEGKNAFAAYGEDRTHDNKENAALALQNLEDKLSNISDQVDDLEFRYFERDPITGEGEYVTVNLETLNDEIEVGKNILDDSSTTNSIEHLQTGLAAAGLYQGTTDGIWGDNTNEAVANLLVQVQMSDAYEGTIDAWYGRKTEAALDKIDLTKMGMSEVQAEQVKDALQSLHKSGQLDQLYSGPESIQDTFANAASEQISLDINDQFALASNQEANVGVMAVK